jgi:hypothetical protein
MTAKKILLVCTLTLLIAAHAAAQWECPSRIGGNLKPLSILSDNLTWATEITTSAGYAGTDGIANAMAFLALDYSWNRFTIYGETGFKSWIRTDGNGYNNQKFSYGMREGFLKYHTDNQSITIGLQSTKSEDYYLINERMNGINYKANFGNWSLNALTGTVRERFSRNGTFCTLGYLYNIVPGRQRTLIGRTFGETNPAMLTVSYHPHTKVAGASGTDEFAATTDEFAPSSNELKIVTVGAFLYHEYGSLIEHSALFSGLFAEAKTLGTTFKPEIILQSANANRALLYSLTLQKEIEWSSGQQTRLFGRYIGIYTIDSTAKALNSFSNVFAGEVLRMDALEMPIIQAGVKHSFPKLKASLKLQVAIQTDQPTGYLVDPYNPVQPTQRMQEYDLMFSKNFGQHLLMNAHLGYLTYPKMTEPFVYEAKHTPWGKIEMRLTY